MKMIMRGRGLVVTMAGLAIITLLALPSCRRADSSDAKSFDEIARPMESPGWITFKDSARVNPKTLFQDHAALFQLPAGNEMKVTSEEVDELGITHFRFQQLYQGVEVENAQFLVRAKGNVAISANGRLEHEFAPAVAKPAVTEEQALEVLLRRLPDVRFYREDHFVQDMEREPTEPPHRPKGKLVWTERPESGERVLAWMFRAYTAPVDRSRRVYVDATTGEFLRELPLLPNCFAGGGNTSFRGFQRINTSRANIPNVGENFVLLDDCNGNKLRLLLPAAVAGTREVFDADNNWVGADVAAVMSFYGLGIAYDYFSLVHGRQSWDGKNGNMTIINDPAEPNARGGNGFITCGTGATASPNDDFNTVDIIGHEFMHSLIEASAQLGYDATKESAALNESFSDIFGQVIERWDEQNANAEWIIGDDKGCGAGATCRDLLNPGTFSHPDTYKGDFWQSTNIDPHVNGGVQNRWFALLTDGGKGTNNEVKAPFDIQYDIQGLGIERTARIAYRTLTRYLTADATYVDARNGSIQAARDLFGVNSVSENQTTKAWCAVGLCPFPMPRQPDLFDRPGGNPNPASPNNNNTVQGATPLGQGIAGISVIGSNKYSWSREKYPRLKVSGLSIFPLNDVDYFRISFPAVDTLGGRCFKPGFTFSFGRDVNARVLIDGVVKQSFKQVSAFTLPMGDTNVEDFVLEVKAPFPGQLVEYTLTVGFFLRVDSLCFQTAPPNKWEQIRDCIACDLDALSGIERVILEPDYRQPTGVGAKDHFFFWRGDGELEIPITILQGNDLTAELVDETGRVVTSAAREPASNGLSVQAPQLPAGVYSLRFSGFGNGTEIQVEAPTAP